jgi:hypothetical protein
MENGKKKDRLVYAAMVAAAGIGFAAPAFGSTIAAIEGQAGGTSASLGDTPTATPPGTDPTAVLTYICSAPNSTPVDGYTYTNWAILANDGTGSLDLFGKIPAGATETTPTVGDGVYAVGTYSPFDDIPEVDALTTFNQTSTGNAVPAPTVVTIPQLTALESSANYGISEYLLALNNVTLSGAASFAVHANTTLTGTDSSGNTITVYQWASSYSDAAVFGGQPVPTGPVDMLGICDVFGSGATASTEFVPFSITPVPEPTSLGLLAVGGLMLLKRRGRNA